MSRFLLVSRTRSHKNLEKVLCRLKTFSLVGDEMFFDDFAPQRCSMVIGCVVHYKIKCKFLGQ